MLLNTNYLSQPDPIQATEKCSILKAPHIFKRDFQKDFTTLPTLIFSCSFSRAMLRFRYRVQYTVQQQYVYIQHRGFSTLTKYHQSPTFNKDFVIIQIYFHAQLFIENRLLLSVLNINVKSFLRLMEFQRLIPRICK